MSLRLLRLWLAAVICGAGSVCAQPTPTSATPEAASAAPPSSTTKKTDDEIVPMLVLADPTIDGALELLEMLTKKAIIRPAALPAMPSTGLNIRRPMPKSEAILAVESLLSMNGIGVVPLGDKLLKVVPLPQVRTEAPTLISESTLDLPPSGRMAAKFFQLEFLPSTEFMQLLPSILTVNVNGVVPFDRANMVLITDTISNLQRVELLLKQVDHPNAAMLKPKYYPLKNAKASDLVQKLTLILSSQKMAAQAGMNATTTLSADDRTNQVIIVADLRLYPFFDDLIDKLDAKGDSNTHTEVIHLKAADSTKLAPLLTQLITGQATAAQRAGQQQQRLAQSGQNIPTPPVGPAGVPGSPQAQNAAAAAQQASAARARLLGTPGAGDFTAEFSSMVTLFSDDRTNSIVVNGTPDDLRLIHELVDQMDVILPQVRIEVVIAEVTLGDADTTGIDALGLKLDANRLVGISGKAGTIALNDGASGFATLTPQSGGNFFGYSLTGILSIATTPRKNDTNILSVPNIVTTHNRKAEIFVGQSVPTISSYLNDNSSVGTTTGTGYRSTVSGQDIGITLKVNPLIGDDGSVQLDIQTEVNDILSYTTIDGNPQPNIGKRRMGSFVTAKSGEVIVLGGLQRTSNTRSTNRLGPIPILGDLFGTRTSKKDRTDLVFFLRPVVLTNSSEDITPAMQRIELSPQKDEIKRVLNPNTPVEGKRRK